MRTLANLLKAAEAVKIEDVMLAVMTVTRPVYEELNRMEMYEGQSPFDKPFHRKNVDYPVYAKMTERIKKPKGQAIDRITLRDTGAFYKALKAEPGSDGFTVTDSDEKFTQLDYWYGPLFGLNTEFMKRYAAIARPIMAAQMITALNVGTGVSAEPVNVPTLQTVTV